MLAAVSQSTVRAVKTAPPSNGRPMRVLVALQHEHLGHEGAVEDIRHIE